MEEFKEEVIFRQAEGIVTLTINRPEERNMISEKTLGKLFDHIQRLNQDNAVRVVILRGEGTEFFCGGIFNPLQMSQLSPEQIRNRRRLGNDLFDKIEALMHPVIAAINGRAQAGGFELALACDIRIAAAHATFAMPENTWGMFPGAGGPIRLPRLVGSGKAMEIIMTGRDVRADEALRIGLVEQVVPPESFAAEVQQLAEAVAASGPLGNRAVKKLVRASCEMDIRMARAYSDSLREPLASSADTAEGIAAYREGRKPRFQGR